MMQLPISFHTKWIAAQAQANDLLHSVQAAQQALPQLSRQFVLMDDLQGGGAICLRLKCFLVTTRPPIWGQLLHSRVHRLAHPLQLPLVFRKFWILFWLVLRLVYSRFTHPFG